MSGSSTKCWPVNVRSLREIDIGAGAIFAIFGLYVFALSLRLDFYNDGVPGPGFFPAVLAIALIVCGVLLIALRLRGTKQDAGRFDLPSRSQARRSLGLWVLVLAATLLINVVGFVISMFLLVAAILLGIEGRRDISTIITVIATPLLAYLLFGWLLQVQLPAGVFGS
jgi:putative tricarboxylic transport membrane protein